MSIADEFSQSIGPTSNDSPMCESAAERCPISTTFRDAAENITSDPLTSSQEDFPVSHSVRPDDERARTIIATSGRKCYESYLSYGRHSSWQKTFLASCLLRTDGFSTRFTTRWKLKTTKHSRRLLFQLAPLARDIGEIEFGLLPTPQARDHFPAHSAEYVAEKRSQGHGMSNLNDHVALMPTPRACEWKNDDYQQKGKYQWNTLTGEAKAMVATPQSRDFRTGQAATWRNPNRSRNLNDQAGGKLSVIFVEWLMGYPEGWTDLKDSETPSSPK